LQLVFHLQVPLVLQSSWYHLANAQSTSTFAPNRIRFLNDTVDIHETGVPNYTAYAYGGLLSGVRCRSGHNGKWA
jgi:hypothetical protein